MNNILEKWRKIPVEARASTAYVICDVLQHCIAFFTMPIFARILTTEQYGQFVIYSSWSGILSIILTLNLAYGSFSKAMVKYEDDRYGYISSIEGIIVCLSIVFMVIYLPFAQLWNRLFELPTYMMCIMVSEMICNTSIMMWCGKKRFEYKYIEVIIVTLLIAISSPIVSLILIYNTEEKGYARIIGFALVKIIIGLGFYIYNAVKGKKLFFKEYWKYALGFNIPLLVYYLSQVVFNQSDRIMISHMINKSSAAVYGVAYSLAIILTFVLNAINNSYVPWFYSVINKENVFENRKISASIAIIMALLLSCVIWFAPEIILIMGGKKYMGAIYVVPPVAVSVLALFYSQLFINVEFYYEEKKQLVYASIGAAVANIVLNYIFIKIYGYVAAAYTTLFSYIIFSLSNYHSMKQILKIKEKKDNMFDYKALIIIMLVFMLCSVIGELLYGLIWCRIIILVIAMVLVFIKRNIIISIYRSITQKEKAQ